MVICPVCVLTIGGGLIILQKLGVDTLISLAVVALTILFILIQPKQKKMTEVKSDDFFGNINNLIKKILNCCG